MSLVSSILESYSSDFDDNNGAYYVSESVSPEAYANATLDGSSVDYCLLESLNAIIDIDRVLNGADIMGSMSMLLEGNDVSAVMENIFTSAIEKLKALFIRVKNAVVAWFKKVYEWLVSYFKHGKEFVKKYGDVLRKKDLTGFTYSGYRWTISAGDAVVDKVYGTVDGDMNRMIQDLTNADTLSPDKLKYTKISDGGNDYITDLVGRTGAGKSIGEMKKSIATAYHNGKTSSDSDLSLRSSDVSEYLAYVETGKDTIKKLKKDESDFEKKIRVIIKTLDGIARKADMGSDTSKNASAVSKCLNNALSVKRAACDAKVSTYRSMLKAEAGILRKLLHYNKKDDDNPVQNGYYDSELYDYFAANPLMESDDVLEDDDFIEECSSFDDDYSDVGESTDLFDQIANMLGI